MGRIQPVPRTTPLMTAKQFARLPDFIGELWDGVAEVADASSGWPSAVGIRIARRLAAYVDRRRLGWVFGEQAGFHVRRHPDRVLSPDVAFVALARLPRMPETGFVPVVPDLVVEVRSPSDPWLETIKKGGIWLGHGAPLVWCVDPPARRVAALRLDGPPEIVGPAGVLRADPVLPRFRLPVAEIFRHPA
jgi:Uma2 family endonuclease